MRCACHFPLSQDHHTIVDSLKSCGKNRDVQRGSQLHAMILREDLLQKNPYVASSLISMYAKCGMFAKAHAILDSLSCRNEVSWSALIAGYAQQGQAHQALDCFDHMQHEGLSPDPIAFTCALKACANINALRKGIQIHEKIADSGFLEKDVVLGTALVDMYAKCGMLSSAREVLLAIPARNVVSWNALIDGYVQQGLGHEVFECFKQMQSEGIFPDVVTYVLILKACSQTGCVHKGKQIHREVSNRGLLVEHVVLGNALVDMYAKCGMLAEAQQLHDDELPVRDLVSWNALISGYAEQERGNDALKCYEQMQTEGFLPDPISFICVLRACGSTKAFEKGKQIHHEVLQRSLFEKHITLGTAVIDMYAKCGMLVKAQEVLDELPFRNLISWSVLIAGYTQQGCFHEALNCFTRMRNECFSPDEVTFTCILKACGSLRAMDMGRRIHHEILNTGFLKKDNILDTALTDMYTRFGTSLRAYNGTCFQSFPCYHSTDAEYYPDRTLNKLEGTAAKVQDPGKVCMGKQKLNNDGSLKKDFRFPEFLSSCTSKDFFIASIGEKGFLHNSPFTANSWISKYVERGMVAEARQMLEMIPDRNVVSWNAVITGYARQGRGQEALRCFEAMGREGLSPNAITFTSLLKACGNAEKGRQLHANIASRGFLRDDVVLGTALMDMYAKCGLPRRAAKQHLQLLVRDTVSWNALISMHARERSVEEALKSIRRMQCEGFAPDAATFASALIACAGAGAIGHGQRIHEEIVIRSLVEDRNMELCNSLVDMYAKCGPLAKAKRVLLHELPARNVVSWNALLAGYARQGRARESLDCFKQMQLEGISPDAITLSCILKAWSRTPLIDMALTAFKDMDAKHGIAPKQEHCTSMVFSLGLAGRFGEAMSVIEAMPSSDYPPLWLALLSVCRRWGNIELARLAFDRLVQMRHSCVLASARVHKQADTVLIQNH